MARTVSSAELLERVQRPDPTVVWRVALAASVLLIGLGALTSSMAPSLGLALIVGLSTVAGQERLTARLTGVVVLAHTLLGLYASLQRSGDQGVFLTHLGFSLLILLTGVAGCWMLRRAPVSAVPETPTAALTDRLGTETLAGHQVLERAAEVLAQLSGAVRFTVQRVDNAADLVRRLDTTRPARRQGDRKAGWRSVRRPRLFRRVQLPRQTDSNSDTVVWKGENGDVLVRLCHPGQSEALVHLIRPGAALGFIEDAARLLQVQVERAALLQEVHLQRELLRDLVYAFSHDLRTPITASILNTQAALRGTFGPLPEAFTEALRSSLEAHQGLLTISDQLMLLAEYESGGPVGDESAVVDLEPVLRTVLDDLTPRASARALRFEVTLDGLSVRGHRYDLRRAFQNLLDNAVKFSPPASLISVRLRREGPLVVVEVRDRGSGVAPEQQVQLFQRFRQSNPGSGTGIGLYLTRRIVERHGGTLSYAREIALEDQPAQTVFSVHLPYVERAVAPVSQTQPSFPSTAVTDPVNLNDKSA